MFNGDGPRIIFIIFLIVIVTAGIFAGAMCLGIWINKKNTPQAITTTTTSSGAGVQGAVAGQIATVFHGPGTSVQSMVNSFVAAVDSGSATGTIYATYINIDMRYKP